MSKFIDRLERASQTAGQPMGFGVAQTVSEKPKIVLVASLAQAAGKRLADYAAGADAVLLSALKSSSAAKTFPEIPQAMSDIPWGGWLGDADQKGIKQMETAGCDFAVFLAANTALAILENSEMGKIVEVAASISDGLLRTVNDLPVDAVLIASEQREKLFLTWHHLMLFQHFANLLTKPLLVSIPSNVTDKELQALWAAGVVGVLVAVGVGQPAGGLKRLRHAIDNLDFPLESRRDRAKPLLPYVGGGADGVAEEEEEEEE